MSKHSTRALLVAVATTLAVAVPASAEASWRHKDGYKNSHRASYKDDCLRKSFRGIHRGTTRVVDRTDRMFKDLFRWCDHRRR